MRNGKKLCVACALPTKAAKRFLCLWPVGNLIITALGLLQSETSDSGDSGEQIQEQMEEMNLHDTIGDDEEKQSIKMKNKSHKNDRSQEQIFLAQLTVPTVNSTPTPLSILKPLGMMDMLLNHR